MSDRISNDDRRIRGGVQCGMTRLVEEWTGQEGVELQDEANRIDSFSGFLDPGERFAFTNKRVFTITIGWVFAYSMDIAAMVGLNRYSSKKMFPKLFARH